VLDEIQVYLKALCFSRSSNLEKHQPACGSITMIREIVHHATGQGRSEHTLMRNLLCVSTFLAVLGRSESAEPKWLRINSDALKKRGR
jgi:hypothetical protein